MKNKKEKPKYNAFQNSLFMIKTAWKTEKIVLVHCILLTVLFIGQQLIELYIAPTVIGAVENKVSISQLLITIGIFIGLLVFLNALKAYVDANVSYPRITVRMALIGAMNRKGCETSYVNWHDKKFMQLATKSDSVVNSNGASSEAIWHTLIMIFRYVLCIGIYATILASVDVVLLLVISVTSVLNFLVSKYINGYEYRHKDELADIERKLWYIQMAEGNHYIAKDIRIFGLGNWLEDLYTQSLNAFRAFNLKAQKVYIIANISSIILTFLRNGFAYAYLISLVLNGGLSASEFLLYFNAVGSAAWWISDILNQFNTLHRQSLDISILREFIEYPEPYKFENGVPLEIKENEKYEIRLENVSFKYPESEDYVLKNFNLTLRSGEKLAVVGLNGAGKTTLVKLICGLFDASEGRVTINGIDIREYNRRDYYKLFSAVFQQFSLLAASVAENVSQNNRYTDIERVKSCIAKAGLTQKIESLPDGYNSMLNREIYEEATELSGGELQRLMLARALYKDAPILILDEPTAALDPIAESEIYEKYNEMTLGKSAVFISHRLASTRFCDRIVLISDGSIAEEGTHQELMANGNKYAELFSVQSKYYSEGGVDDAEE